MIFKVFLICFLFQTIECYPTFEKIKLSDIKVVTLYSSQYTIGNKPIPQLQCTSSSSTCQKYSPKTVQCENKGWDGFSYQWNCKASLPKNVQFDSTIVNCELADSSSLKDVYVIEDSCSLKYSLKLDDVSTQFIDPFLLIKIFLCIFVVIIILGVFCQKNCENFNNKLIEEQNSIQPIHPRQTIHPIHPEHKIQPIEPFQPLQPIQPIHPIQPIQPIQPVQPIQPIDQLQQIGQSLFTMSRLN